MEHLKKAKKLDWEAIAPY